MKNKALKKVLVSFGVLLGAVAFDILGKQNFNWKALLPSFGKKNA